MGNFVAMIWSSSIEILKYQNNVLTQDLKVIVIAWQVLNFHFYEKEQGIWILIKYNWSTINYNSKLYLSINII